MKLYYGSKTLLTKPICGVGNPTNDYGVGLYLTPDLDMARLWASRYEEGYAITYDLDMTGLKVLRLDNNTNEDILKWITLLISHRFDYRTKEMYKERIEFLENSYLLDIDKYDVIIGYRADDSYFAYSRDFLSNVLSIEKLKEAMILGHLGKQIVLKSKKAFSKICYVSSEVVSKSNEYNKFRENVLDKYHRLKTQDSDSNTFIRDIIRGKR